MPLRKAVHKAHELPIDRGSADLLRALKDGIAASSSMPIETPDEPAPWWADTDWFQGLTTAEIDARLGSLPADQDWVVVPVGYADQLRTSVASVGLQQTDGSMPFSAAEYLARELLLIMVQRIGYSTAHAQNAWDMALAYEQARAKNAARTRTTGGGQ